MRQLRRIPRAAGASIPNTFITAPSSSSTQPILTSLFTNRISGHQTVLSTPSCISSQRAFFCAPPKPPTDGGAGTGTAAQKNDDKKLDKKKEVEETKDAAKVAEEEAAEKNKEVGVESETIVRELQNASEQKAKESIDVKEVEQGMAGLLWFSDVFPTQIANWDIRPQLTATNHQKVIPQLLPKEVKVDRMVPRPRDGGVFVYFKTSPDFVRVIRRSQKPEQKDQKIHDLVCMAIERYSQTHPVRAFLCPYPIRAFQVRFTSDSQSSDRSLK